MRRKIRNLVGKIGTLRIALFRRFLSEFAAEFLAMVVGFKRIQVEQKSFEIKKGKFGRLDSVVIKEKRRGLESCCEIDGDGVRWLVEKLQEEALIQKEGKEQWSHRSKSGLLLAIRDSNPQGIFIRVSWTLGFEAETTSDIDISEGLKR